MVSRAHFLGLVLALVTGTSALGQNALGDREFLAASIEANNLEIKLGQLAERRGATPEVRASGQGRDLDREFVRILAELQANDLPPYRQEATGGGGVAALAKERPPLLQGQLETARRRDRAFGDHPVQSL
jgi:hypothetical protein